MRLTDTLRGRVGLAAAASLACVLVVVGALLVISTSSDDRRQLDRRLDRRAELLAGAVGTFGSVDAVERQFPRLDTIGRAILSTGQTGVRVFSGPREALSVGDLPAGGLPAPTAVGLRTVEAADGTRWRAATRRAGTGELIEVLGPLAPLEDRARSLERRVLLLGALGVLAAGLLAALAAGLALRTLDRLRATAEHVAETEALDARAPSEGTREVRALAGSLNRMLGRLQSSAADRERALEATRRFVADAGHELRTPVATIGANLEALERNPGLPAAERREVVTETIADQRRMAALVEGLQALARGDAGPLGDEQRVDLGELAAAAAGAVRARHPQTRVRVEAEEIEVDGSPTGLRMLIDNLLENAARHAGQGREPAIQVRVEGLGEGARIVVEDDGPGIPEAERARVLERFQRAPGAAPGGSGLGLAIVAQQAARHGGAVSLGDSPLGGARVEVTLA
jgi:signal transduction histidine kinase